MKYLTTIRKFVRKFITRQEEGATLAEYGLLLALIAVVCIGAIALLAAVCFAAVSILGSRINTMCSSLVNTL